MTDITKNITNHYQELVGGELEKIHVPEWKMDVYYKKTNSFAVEAKVINLQAQGKIVQHPCQRPLVSHLFLQHFYRF